LVDEDDNQGNQNRGGSILEILCSNNVLQSLVIKPDTKCYTLWSYFEGIFLVSSALIYPYCAAFGFPHSLHTTSLILFSSELVAILSMVIHFFLAYKEEGSLNFETNQKKIAMKYLKGRFRLDIIVFTPFGLLGHINKSRKAL